MHQQLNSLSGIIAVKYLHSRKGQVRLDGTGRCTRTDACAWFSSSMNYVHKEALGSKVAAIVVYPNGKTSISSFFAACPSWAACQVQNNSVEYTEEISPLKTQVARGQNQDVRTSERNTSPNYSGSSRRNGTLTPSYIKGERRWDTTRSPCPVGLSRVRLGMFLT